MQSLDLRSEESMRTHRDLCGSVVEPVELIVVRVVVHKGWPPWVALYLRPHHRARGIRVEDHEGLVFGAGSLLRGIAVVQVLIYEAGNISSNKRTEVAPYISGVLPFVSPAGLNKEHVIYRTLT